MDVASVRLSLSDDLPTAALVMAVVACLATVVLLALELGPRRGQRPWIFVTGVLATLLSTVAVLRPLRVTEVGRRLPARFVVLVDGSHRMTLPALGGAGPKSRKDVAREVVEGLRRDNPGVELDVREFAEGPLSGVGERVDSTSRLTEALDELERSPAGMPPSVVVVSDGRLATPTMEQSEAGAKAFHEGATLHTIAVTDTTPRDRSVRQVLTTEVAVAHQPLRLDVEVGCVPSVLCDGTEVVVSELLEGRPAELLGRGQLGGEGELRRLTVELTLDRAGERLIEVRASGAADEIADNDARILPISVRRDRTRILHVAGRPSYDVRALRSFLEGDASIDLVSFFILRTQRDDVSANEDEIALIPFPVEELFTEHLPSFDAVVLQDIDAVAYGLDDYLEPLAEYVRRGGGLVMVGGPTGFSAGGYARTPIEEVLPVTLPSPDEAVDEAPVTPAYTASGRAAPALGRLRRLVGDTLPRMSGSNVLGPARPGAQVLWQHDRRVTQTPEGRAGMPLLVLGEVADGRSVALAVNGTYHLGFGSLGVRTGGEGHRALWEGLLGWLMRDPRYESAQLAADGPCIAGRPLQLSLSTLPTPARDVRLEISPLSSGGAVAKPALVEPPSSTPGDEPRVRHAFRVTDLTPGGHAARAFVSGTAPSRLLVPCEVGGAAWADSRPDQERLARIAAATGGVSRKATDELTLPQPERPFLTSERHSRPILPAWAWSTLASVALGVHWLVRRRGGLV